MEKQGIKETLELLDGLLLIGKKAASAFGDGKVQADDLNVLIGLLMEVGKLKDAFTGLEKLGAELKDLDESELVQLGSAVFKGAAEIMAEVKRQKS